MNTTLNGIAGVDRAGISIITEEIFQKVHTPSRIITGVHRTRDSVVAIQARICGVDTPFHRIADIRRTVLSVIACGGVERVHTSRGRIACIHCARVCINTRRVIGQIRTTGVFVAYIRSARLTVAAERVFRGKDTRIVLAGIHRACDSIVARGSRPTVRLASKIDIADIDCNRIAVVAERIIRSMDTTLCHAARVHRTVDAIRAETIIGLVNACTI